MPIIVSPTLKLATCNPRTMISNSQVCFSSQIYVIVLPTAKHIPNAILANRLDTIQLQRAKQEIWIEHKAA